MYKISQYQKVKLINISLLITTNLMLFITINSISNDTYSLNKNDPTIKIFSLSSNINSGFKKNLINIFLNQNNDLCNSLKDKKQKLEDSLKFVIYYKDESDPNKKRLYFIYRLAGKFNLFTYKKIKKYFKKEEKLWDEDNYNDTPRSISVLKILTNRKDENPYIFKFTTNRDKDNAIWYYVSKDNSQKPLPSCSNVFCKFVESDNYAPCWYFKETVYFAINETSVDVNSEDFRTVKEMINKAYISEQNNYYIYFIGHGDHLGRTEVNEKISKERAYNVMQKILYVFDKDISFHNWFKNQKVELWICGNDLPAGKVSNKSYGDAYNRRCDVIVTSDPAIVENEYLERRGGRNKVEVEKYY